MDTNLETIRTKIRRLTRSPSTAQISNIELNKYINRFVLYDFPEHLRLFSLRTTLTFYTKPYVDTYETTDVVETDPLYNFKNKHTTIHPPVYVGGYYVAFSQSRDQFYAGFPLTNNVSRIGTGDGAVTNFDGTLTGKPVLQNNVTITSIDANNLGITLVDVPRIDGITGYPTQMGDLVTPDDVISRGTINYVTGVYNLTFVIAPAAAAPIYSHTIPYQPSRPNMVLYYNNKFVMRPVPDKVYPVVLDAYIRPTELLADNQVPDMEQYSEYIAYGAAKKLFEDRMDMDSVQMIMPEFKQQETLCLRRTLVQQSNERVATIYSGQTGFEGGWNKSGTYY